MSRLDRLGTGTTAVVYALDNKRALKKYLYPTDHERNAYERVGSHPKIARYFGTQDDGSLILERGKLLRLQGDRSQITYQMKISWLRDAAEAIKHIHQRQIVHSDIGCHNMVLVGDRLKLIDFGGCSIDGSPAISAYEWFSYREMDPPVTRQSDISAYGCMVYEIITGEVPYQQYKDEADRVRIVQELYKKGHYPDVTGLPLRALMTQCWSGDLKSMDEVIHVLSAEVGLRSRVRLAIRARIQKIQTSMSKIRCI